MGLGPVANGRLWFGGLMGLAALIELPPDNWKYNAFR